MDSYFKIENLSCGYRNGFKLQNVNITIKRGSFTAILGRNGSGKSTLFKALVGDVPLLNGQILLNENDLKEISGKEKAKSISIVTQMMELSPIIVEDYILMGRTPYMKSFQFSYTNEDISIAKSALEQTGIAHLKDSYMTELSGGEQQLVSLAAALTQEPDLLLLDEPTSHLDITYQSEIMEVLSRLNQTKQITILMIIHDINLASAYCDNLILMSKGEIIIQGKPEDVINQKNIDKAYGNIGIVGKNPLSGNPNVFPKPR